jgi:hypothetical protein
VKLAKHFGFSFNVVTQDGMFTGARLHEPLYLDGNKIEREEAERLYGQMTTIMNQLTSLCENINSRNPWLSSNAEQLDNVSLGTWLDDKVNEIAIGNSEKKLLRSVLESEFANKHRASPSMEPQSRKQG